MDSTLQLATCRFAQGWRTLLITLAIVAGMYPLAAQAVTPVNLLQEGFQNEGFPPSGWTDDSYGGWYMSTNGFGATDGSAVMDFWDCYDATLTTPVLDASAFAYTGDSAVVEFDLWMEADYYSIDYGGDVLEVNAYSSTGQTNILSLNSAKDYTYDNTGSYGYEYDPLTDQGYWKHYSIEIPAAYRTNTLQIGWHGSTPSRACGGNAAIDNVVIHGVHTNTLGVSPALLAFGGLLPGETSRQLCLTITNENPTPFTLSNLAVMGDYASDYTIISSPEVIPAGALGEPSTSTICLTFTPSAGGDRNATLNFSTNADSPTDVVIPLTGKGLVPIASVSPTVLFSKSHIKLGQSAKQVVLVSNIGYGELFVSSESFIGGMNPQDYSILQLPTSPILAGGVDTMVIGFSPRFEGAHSATLNVLTNAMNSPLTVDLKGVGILPRLTVSPSLVNFDSVPVGTTACKTVTFSNPGTDTLKIRADFLSSKDVDFSYAGLKSNEMTILPGTFRSALVCFTPVRGGTRVATLRVETNIPSTYEELPRDTSAMSISIIGVGNAVGRLSIAATTTMDTIPLGLSVCNSDTLFNLGAADIVVNSLTLSGSAMAEFQVSGITLPLTLRPGVPVAFNLCATPTSRGLRSAMITATGSSDGQVAALSVPVAMVGVSVCATASPETLFDGKKTIVGMVDSAVITVENCGDVARTYDAELAQSNGFYRLDRATSASVPAGGTTQFVVFFQPLGQGGDNAVLAIRGRDVAPMTVQLHGFGGKVIATAAEPQVPDTRVGEESAVIQLTISNTGDFDWTPGAPSVDNPNFKYISGANNVILAGAQGVVLFTFNPRVVGPNSSVVTFPLSSPKETPALGIRLTGQGLTPQGVARTAEANGFVLNQNYPNPFNPTTEISFTTPVRANVSIELIDVTGRVVRTILNEHLSAGTHSVRIDASTLPSGVYQYRLSSGETSLTRRMVLSK